MAHFLADRLAEYTGCVVRMWDERLTSVEADRVLRESGISIEKRPSAVVKPVMPCGDPFGLYGYRSVAAPRLSTKRKVTSASAAARCAASRNSA